MPALDTGRSRARLTADDLALLADLVAGDPEAAAAPRLPVLEEAGLVVDAMPAVEVADLLPVLFDAELVIDVESTCRVVEDGVPGETVLRHGLHLRGPYALALESFPGTEELDLGPVDPALVPMMMARLAGLHGRPTAPVAPVTLPTDLLDDLLVGLVTPRQAEQAGPPLREMLTARLPALTREQVAGLVALLTLRRSTWRMTARHRGGDDGRTWSARTLTVLDGGLGGLWERLPLVPGAPPDQVVLAPRTPAQVWSAMVELLDTPEPAGQTGPVQP